MTSRGESFIAEARARLHFGLLQTAGERKRRFGGVGLFLKDPAWRVTLTPATDLQLLGLPLDAELVEVTHAIFRDWQSRNQGGVELCVTSAIPLHVGLGAKTSFVQALSYGLAAIAGGAAEASAMLANAGRGKTSGIGSSAPFGGGFTLDVGVKEASTWLPSSSATWNERSASAVKLPFPDCQFLLAREKGAIGLSGLAERAIFIENLPLSESEIDKLAAVILFDLIPSITTADLAGIREAFRHMQSLGFKRIEWAAQSPLLHQLRKFIEANGGSCALSSLGPTIAILSDQSPANVAELIRFEFGDAFSLRETYPMNDMPVTVDPIIDGKRDPRS